MLLDSNWQKISEAPYFGNNLMYRFTNAFRGIIDKRNRNEQHRNHSFSCAPFLRLNNHATCNKSGINSTTHTHKQNARQFHQGIVPSLTKGNGSPNCYFCCLLFMIFGWSCCQTSTKTFTNFANRFSLFGNIFRYFIIVGFLHAICSLKLYPKD